MSSAGLEAMGIVGYCDPWSVGAGESISFMVSTRESRFTAELVRLRHDDRDPEGPGPRRQVIPSAIDGTYVGREQEITVGSYAIVTDAEDFDPAGGITLATWILPTVSDWATEQGLITRWDEHSRSGFGMFLERGNRLGFRAGEKQYVVDAGLRKGEWAFVAASWNPPAGRLLLVQRPQSTLPQDPARATLTTACAAVGASIRDAVEPSRPASRSDIRPATKLPLILGGHQVGDRPRGTFNGKLASPVVYASALSDAEVEQLRAGELTADLADRCSAAWDPAGTPDAIEVLDTVGAHHATLVNHPTQGVTGHNWNGHDTDFQAVPTQYNALHFHTDDLEDAGWEPSLTLHIPDALASGVYAARLKTSSAEDLVPFFVRPPAEGQRPPVVFLAPTLSYLAYANEHSAAAVHSENADFNIEAHYQSEDRYAIAVPLSGLYDHHPDGSGHCYSSWLRPIVSNRPHYQLPVARSVHQLSADLHLLDWMEKIRVDHDVVTDHDLHAQGASLIRRYSVVVTGTHPEYWTEPMLDALEEYLAGGGRLMYMGGNGFYWVTSISPSRRHLIEVRRGRRGTASWRNEPGEDHHSTTGELGGLWRDRGRAPQRVGGVGMTGQGFGPGIGYRRTEESHAPVVSWIFHGVPSESFGDFGLILGGAAGFEFDRMDTTLGTPVNAVCVASARGFSDAYQHVVEEVTTSDSRQDGTVSPFVCADMVYYPRSNGSAVFATGSIAWCGALSHNGYNNDVARITENVLRRFMDRTTELP